MTQNYIENSRGHRVAIRPEIAAWFTGVETEAATEPEPQIDPEPLPAEPVSVPPSPTARKRVREVRLTRASVGYELLVLADTGNAVRIDCPDAVSLQNLAALKELTGWHWDIATGFWQGTASQHLLYRANRGMCGIWLFRTKAERRAAQHPVQQQWRAAA